jgi:hypothetical protein
LITINAARDVWNNISYGSKLEFIFLHPTLIHIPVILKQAGACSTQSWHLDDVLLVGVVRLINYISKVAWDSSIDITFVYWTVWLFPHICLVCSKMSNAARCTDIRPLWHITNISMWNSENRIPIGWIPKNRIPTERLCYPFIPLSAIGLRILCDPGFNPFQPGFNLNTNNFTPIIWSHYFEVWQSAFLLASTLLCLTDHAVQLEKHVICCGLANI